MARTPRLVLDGEAVETLLSLPSTSRKRIIRTLEQLGANDPQESQDFEERDARADASV